MSDVTPRNLGIIRGLRWTLASPRWSPCLPVVFLLIVPELLAVGLEGRVANPLKQYLGVFPGDLLLSFAVGASFWLAINYLEQGQRRWYQTKAWQGISVGLGLLFTWAMFYGELQNTLHRYMPSAAYSMEQFVSPTNLFHYVLVAVVTYLLWAVTLPVLVHTPRRYWILKALIILAIVGWGVCAIYLDNVLPRPNLADVHGVWFGGWYR